MTTLESSTNFGTSIKSLKAVIDYLDVCRRGVIPPKIPVDMCDLLQNIEDNPKDIIRIATEYHQEMEEYNVISTTYYLVQNSLDKIFNKVVVLYYSNSHSEDKINNIINNTMKQQNYKTRFNVIQDILSSQHIEKEPRIDFRVEATNKTN